ncbi:unnamed protein product [Closterium sp. NIES-53]
MYLMTCTRPDLAYPLSILARYVALGRHRPEHMVAAKRVLRYLCSTSGLGLVLGGRSPVVLTGHADASWVDDLATSRCEAQIYTGAMTALELRWLTYLLTDLGEPPRSPPVLYVDNKAMLALCREHRLEHRTKHIALRYFLARELQQRGQLRLAYVASQANTADIFTEALQPCDHQRFCTMLACFALLCLTDTDVKSSTTAAAVMLTFDNQGLNDIQNSRDYIAQVGGWGDMTNMPMDEGAWGAQEPDETTWGETPADRDRRLLTEAEQRVADMEVLDSGRLVGIEPKPAASDQESGELVLSPSEYIDVDIKVPPPNLTRFIPPVTDHVRADGHRLLLSFFANADYYLRAQGHKAIADIWHKHLGHPSQSTLNNTIKAAVLDKNSLLLPGSLEMKPVNRPSPCLICPAANLPHELYPTHFPGADDYCLMEKVYSDILNLSAEGFNGEKYVITFTEASTRYVWTGNMTNRFLAFTAFRTWLLLAERESDTKLKTFQCDGAREHRSLEFTTYLQERGIRYLFSLPHAHQQSGVAERLNRTLQEKMRALLAQSQLGPLYWPFAMDHATLLHNLLLRTAFSQPARSPPLRCPAFARPACCAAMASLCVLAFDHEGRPIQFDTWLDDLQLYPLSDSRDSVSLFDQTSAQALYDTVVARYDLFPELSAFAIVEDLVSHLRTSDARYRAALPAEFLAKNPPPMDHFLALDPTALTVDLLEQHLLAAKTSVVAVGAARGTPRTPFFEGCSPSPLAPSYTLIATTDVPGVVGVGAASATAKRRSSKGKGGRGGGGGSGGGGGGSSGGRGGSEGGGSGRSGGGSGGFGDGGGGSSGSGGSGSGGSGGGRTGAQRGEFGEEAERPCWTELLRSGVPIFDLEYDAILAAMYALSASAEGDSYLCVPPDPGVEAAAQGASESVLPGTAPAEALQTFTLDSGASRYFFLDSTTLTPLSAPVPVRLADPSGGPVLARSSTMLPCPAVPSSSLSRLHLPSFSTNLTLLWHHRLVPPSLPRLHGMHSRLLVSGLPRSLPPLTPSPALTCLPCVEGRQRAAPHSSSFPPTSSPPQTLHMDVGGEFFSDLLRDFCRGEGFLLTFTLPDSPKKNGIAEHRIGLVMEVARTSMIHAAAPHFLWPFAVRYGMHQLNLWPHVSLPETSPTLRWTGKVGDASMFQVWGSCAFVRDTSEDKLSSRAIPCVFLGFSPGAHGWQFYHPTSRRVFPSQDVTFDKSVPLYHLFPYRSAPPPPPLLFLAPGPPPVDPLPPRGPAPSGAAPTGASGGAEPRGAESEGAGFGVAEPWGAESEGAGSGVAEPWGEEPGGAEPEGVEPGGAQPEGVEPKGAETGGAEPRGTASSGGPAGASPQLSPRPEPLSPQQLREWFSLRTCLRSGATGAGDSAAGDTGAGGPGVTVGPGGTGGAAAAGRGAARTEGTGAAGSGGVGGARGGDPTEPGAAGAGGAGAIGAGAGGTGAGGAGAGGAGAGDADLGAGGVGGIVRPRPYFVPLLQQVLGVLSSTGLPPPLLCPPPDQSQPLLQPASPLPAPSPYTKQTSGLTERREPASRPASSVRIGRCVPRLRPPAVPGTHTMALRPSSVPLHVPLLPPPESSLPAVPDLASDLARAASPTVPSLLASVVSDPSFESTAASSLVAKLLDFAAACRLDYPASLIAESDSDCPPSVKGECALGMDVLEDKQEDFECLAATVPHLVPMLLAPEGDPDAPDIPTPRSSA